MLRNNLFKKALSDSGFYLISQTGTKLASILVIPFLVRAVSVEQYGQYEFFLLITGLLTAVVGLGMDSGIASFVVDKDCSKNLLNYLFTVSICISISIICLLWLIAYLLFSIFFSDLFPSILLLHFTFLYLLSTYFTYLVFNFVRWLGKSKQAAFVSFLGTILGITIGFLFITKNPTIENYVLGLFLGNGLGFIISLLIAWPFLNFKKTNAIEYQIKLIQFIKVSIPFVPTYVSNNLMIFSDRIIIMSFMGDYALGIYAMASRIAQIPSFLLNVVSRGFQPVLFTNYETPEGAALNRKVFTIFILFLLPTFIFFLFFSGSLVHLFGGDKYMKAIPLLPYVSMTNIIIGIIGVTGVGYFVKKKTYYITFIIFFIILLNFIINYWMIYFFGINGVSVGGMITICIGSFCYIWFSEKLYSFNLKLRWMIFTYTLLIIIALLNLK